MTLGDDLRKDPRIAQAKKLLHEALAEQQRKIKGVCGPKENLEARYEEILNNFARLRGGPLYYPYLGSGLGKGSLVELADGSIKYDMINGIGPHFAGHSNPHLVDTSVDAAIEDTIMQGHLQQNSECVELLRLLTDLSGLSHCFLSSSGAMANENTFKIAFQKRAPASRVLAFEHCFMGRSIVMAHVTDKPAYREGLPQTIHVDYVPFYDHKNPEESTARALHVLEGHLNRHAYALMSMELVQGEGGFYPGTEQFFKKIIHLLKKHQVLVHIDEIQTFGRTGELFAFHHFGLQGLVDICTIGKLSQVCATLYSEHLVPKPGLLSQTFTSSTAAIKASIWIIQTLAKGNYYGKKGRIAELHASFEKALKKLEPKVSGPYGIGAMIAFTPLDGDAKRVVAFAKTLFKNGVISFIAGSNPTRIRFLIPALVITQKDIDAVMEIVAISLKESE